MADHDSITCWRCGYVLDGLRVDGTCPECGTPVWSDPPQAATIGKAVASLVLGIVSLVSLFVCLGPLSGLVAIPALILAHLTFRKARLNGVAKGTGMARGGQVCAIITLVLCGLYLLLFMIPYLYLLSLSVLF